MSGEPPFAPRLPNWDSWAISQIKRRHVAVDAGSFERMRAGRSSFSVRCVRLPSAFGRCDWWFRCSRRRVGERDEDGRRRKVKKNVSAMTRQLYHSEAVITAC